MKPRLFVGSASEDLDVAYAVQAELANIAEVTVWTQGLFKLTHSVLEGLFTALDTNDFGIFVFTPLDLTTFRDAKKRTVRDNVLFELGLFLGRFGRDRSFILMPQGAGDLRMPSDLTGVVPATYDSQRSDGNLHAAVGPACFNIRKAISKVGSKVGERGAPSKSRSRDLSMRAGNEASETPAAHEKSSKSASPPGSHVEHRIVQTALEYRACKLRIAAHAREILYVTGSRSNSVEYLKMIEAQLAKQPELIHYRVLFGPPHYENLKNHLRRLLELRTGRDADQVYKTIFLGLYKNTIRQSETLILGNEHEAIILLPSFSGVGEINSCLLLTSPATVEAMKQFVKQLYTASETIETAEAIDALKVLRQG